MEKLAYVLIHAQSRSDNMVEQCLSDYFFCGQTGDLISSSSDTLSASDNDMTRIHYYHSCCGLSDNN